MELTTKYELNFGSLDLGNNYTYDHMYKAIAEHKHVDSFFSELGNCEHSSEVRIKAKLNFGYRLDDVFIVSELYDAVESAYNEIIDRESIIEPNTCAWCDKTIPEDDHVCSDDCGKKWSQE